MLGIRMLDEKKIHDEAKRLVTESPNNVYSPEENGDECSYVNGECSNGSTGCLFGQTISNVYPEFNLEEVDGQSIRTVIDNSFLFGTLAHFFSFVQRKQDKEVKWKDSWNDSIDNEYFGLEVEEIQ
jgi:hypothetical protein